MTAENARPTPTGAILLKGGRVVDPMYSRDGMFDVRIENGRFAQIDRDLPRDDAHVVEVPSSVVVCPGLIDTEMVRATISDSRAKAHADSFPIARLGEPWEVAELVAFLASDRAAYITGASLDINGGGLMV